MAIAMNVIKLAVTIVARNVAVIAKIARNATNVTANTSIIPVRSIRTVNNSCIYTNV